MRTSRRRGCGSEHEISKQSKRRKTRAQALWGKRKAREMQANETLKKAGRCAMAVTLAATLAIPTAALSSGTAFAAAGFPDEDVIPGVWYEDYIQWAVDNGIIAGYPDGTFGHEDNVTRAQVAVMLCRSAGADIRDEEQWPENKTPWTDVEDRAYYTQAMNWAYEHGVFQGDAQEGGVITGLVRPGDSISREEIAAVIARYAERNLNLDISTSGMEWPEGTINQDDVSTWAESMWMWVANTGIMSGNALPDGTNDLAPHDTTTRAMFAKIVTTLVRDVAPNAEQRPDRTIGQVAAHDVTESSARIVVLDDAGKDITEYCEFSRDAGITWNSDPVLTLLEADSPYTVTARVRGELDSAKWMATSFTTLEAHTPIKFGHVMVDVVKGRDSVTLTALDWYGEPVTEGIEYAVCKATEEPSAWQDSPSFDGLEINVGYKALVREKAADGRPAGEPYYVTFAIPESEEQPAAPDAPHVEATFGTFTEEGGTATLKATDDAGKDITSLCEFSWDTKEWFDSPVLDGLKPLTSYTVYGRVKAVGDVPASNACSVGFETPAAETTGPEDEQGTVEVVEYKLVSRSYTQMYGLETETPYGKGVYSYRDDFVQEDPPEVLAAYQELQDYGKMMLDLGTAPTDKCDTLSVSIIRHDYYLIKTGSHTETYRNAEEKAKLYAHGTSCIPAEKLRVTGGNYRMDIEYTMADGTIVSGKHAAWEYREQTGNKPVDVHVYSTPTFNGPYDAKSPAQMVRDAGGDPNQPWCLDSDGMILG